MNGLDETTLAALTPGSSPWRMRAGKVTDVIGTLVRATGVDVRCGDFCELRTRDGALLQLAEAVGFQGDKVLLMPLAGTAGLSRSTLVVDTGRPLQVRVGPGLLGRVVDVLGKPIDGKGAVPWASTVDLMRPPPGPMERPMIGTPLVTGIRCVDALATIGEGQRMGIFAPAGTGKSTLMSMFARGASCDVNVITLIGERGREVREFIERVLGPEGMARSVVVCATSDRSAVERSKAAYVGTAVAEYFRDQGMKVLLMMDSLTRFARAQREIGLAAGEPPTRRGFPPSVFAELPRLLERAGRTEKGSITALYTILSEDETSGDPIAEEVRSILDGHLLLSRSIAARNRYPAIDVLNSLSRVMGDVVPRHHAQQAAQVRRLMSRYQEVETLLRIGEYKAGSDPLADEAIAKNDAINDFLGQAVESVEPYARTLRSLAALGAGPNGGMTGGMTGGLDGRLNP
ncbi:MAG: EscN/YscN/HrcN family type III secretion system ATPase [Comamonadaceae bacterium]|nr:MAG: EscN/YscN/HrcN family type III secretion system ATPase [Comamonadaceae bacterium]